MKQLLPLIFMILICALTAHAQSQQTYTISCTGVAATDTTLLTNQITAASGNARTLVLAAVPTCSFNTFTTPANITLDAHLSAPVVCNTGQTCTVNGPYIAPPTKALFTGAGTVVITGKRYLDQSDSLSIWPPPTSSVNDLGDVTGTVTFDLNTGSYQKLHLTGNITSSTAINPAQGRLMTIEIRQGTSAFTFSWPANFIGAPTMTTILCNTPTTGVNCPDGATTKASFWYDGTNWRFIAGLENTSSSQMLNPSVLAGRVLIANAFPGTTVAGQIARADASCGTAPCTLIHLGGGYFGDQTIAPLSLFDYDHLGYVVLHSYHNLILGCGDYTGGINGFEGYILPQSHTSITGQGACTRLFTPTGVQGAPIIIPHQNSLNGAGADENIEISRIQFMGQVVSQITDLVVNNGSFTATSASAPFTPNDQGKTMWLVGVNSYSTLIAYVSPTTVTLTVAPSVSGTKTARYVYYSSVTPHVSLGNCFDCSVHDCLFTNATSIALQGGGNSNGLSTHATIAQTGSPQTISTGFTQPTVRTRMQVAGGQGGQTGTVTINGTTITGEPLAENFTLSGTTVQFGFNFFASITSIVVPAQTNSGDTVIVKTWGHAENVKLFNNTFVGGVSQNAALVNAENSEIRGNTFRSPGQLYGPGVSVIDLETNAANDIIVGNTVANNLVDAAYMTGAANTGISFTNNNASINGQNRIINNTIVGYDPHLGSGLGGNVQNGITIAGGNCPAVGGIHETEIGGNKITGAVTNGYQIIGGCRLQIHDNFCRGCGSAGSALSMTGGVTDSTVFNNEFRRFGGISDNTDINDSDVTNHRNVFYGNRTDNIVVAADSVRYNNYCVGDPPVSSGASCVLSFPTTSQPAGTRIEALPATLTGATPSVANVEYGLLSNGGATSISNFTNGLKGQVITLQGDSNTTILNNGNIANRSGANITPFNGLTQSYRFDGAVWRQVN